LDSFIASGESLFNFNKFKMGDLNVIKDDSLEAQKKYLEQVNAAANQAFKGLQNKSIKKILGNFLEKKDPALLQKSINGIQYFINALLKIDVPELLSQTHLEYVNNWSQNIEVFEAILNINKDALKSVVALKYYADTILPNIVYMNIYLTNIYKTLQ